jgi:hypothetical protein
LREIETAEQPGIAMKLMDCIDRELHRLGR